jgi:hypothetical protein
MDKRRATASAMLPYLLIAVAGAGVGAFAATGITRHPVPAAPGGFVPVEAVATHADDSVWPLADGGLLTSAAVSEDDGTRVCEISRFDADGTRQWSQHMPTLCVVYGIDDAGGAWVRSDALYRLDADGSAHRLVSTQDVAFVDAPASVASNDAMPRTVPAVQVTRADARSAVVR